MSLINKKPALDFSQHEASQIADSRASDLLSIPNKHWFWHTVWNYRRYLTEATFLTIAINVLGLAGSLFTMTVYDRVIPNQAYVTLWTLAIGVIIAMLFEMAARIYRAKILDDAGKKIDLALGARIFRQAIGVRMEHRAHSTGVHASILKEYESLREFVTSATLTMFADMPFVILFLMTIVTIAGPLAWPVLVSMTLMIAIAFIGQISLGRLMKEQQLLGAQRHGIVVESLENLEMIKATGAENNIAWRHDAVSLQQSQRNLKTKHISQLLSTLLATVNQLSTVAVIVFGTYLAGSGAVSVGAIIGTIMLTGRAMQPVMTLSSLALRLQGAKAALDALSRLMATPQDRDPQRHYLETTMGAGEIEYHDIDFTYQQDLPLVLNKINLKISPGEVIGILGRVGSGKSTLLRLLCALYRPTSGRIYIDGIDITQIDPLYLRKRIILVPQEARLLYGTLRENLLLGAGGVSDEDLLEACKITGVTSIAARHPKGFDMPIGERGDTLSGGQRQAISLARAILCKPDVLLLDEPTSGMDVDSERLIMQALESIIKERTVIIVTHKPSLLQFIQRLIVIDNGKIVADGARDHVLKLLSQATQQPPAPA